MSDSSVYCIYAVASVKRETRLLLSKGWKQFYVFTETESLDYICDQLN